MSKITDDGAAFSHQTRRMFTAIAPRYDFLNQVLSVGLDRYWRKKAVDLLMPASNELILDIATGTGDILIEIAKRNLSNQIYGIDFSRKMLDLARIKVNKFGFNKDVSFQIGSGELLPYADKSFDGVLCAFGIRNFYDIKKGLMEFHRILKPGGRLIILEFSIPKNPAIAYLYECYFHFILPKIGNLVSGHDNAYTYLPESVADFPNQRNFIDWIKKSGFNKASFIELSFGIVSIHSSHKPI
jgi:demethylmenaquinone methyltransferase / 2-methoxy-6-polyprenyl-1,4-benzoquinol methylase